VDTEDVKTRVDFEVGEVVRIVAGPFADMVGNVEEIHADQQKLKVLVSMFGRETPLEVDFSQVDKLV
jgi:transcription termination/antitermination protein NusG